MATSNIASHIASYAKIAGKSVFKGLLVAGTGMALCLAGVVVGVMLVNNHATEGLVLAMQTDWLATALVAVSGALPFLYAQQGTKASVETSVFLLWEEKLADFVVPKLGEYVKSILAKSPNWLKGTSNGAVIKAKLIENSESDASLHKIQRYLLSYGLEKIELDQVSQIDAENLPITIGNKIKDQISGMTEPSLSMFWWTFASQLALLALAVFFDK